MFLTSILTYFTFLLLSSIAITAFFCVTRGYTEVLADGSEHRYGKILKGYYFFWFRKEDVKRVQYRGDELALLLHRAAEWYAGPLALVGNALEPVTINSFRAPAAIMQYVPLLRKKLEVGFTVEAQGEEEIILSAWDEEPVYVYPEWLRTVMAGCITCTPTVYGNIAYWGMVLALKDSVLYEGLYGVFINEAVGVVVVWLVYWVSLAWLNTVLYKMFEGR